MSGWIKFEKSLRTDPRTLRMARALVTQERYTSVLAVTLVVGALVQLWAYMDDHGREDNTLDLSADELDELVGLPGFARLMPSDWLVALDDGRVELPCFQEHNGAEAKKRALTAKRVERHRAPRETQPQRISVTSALPDQTRPDQDKTKDRRVPTEPVPQERDDDVTTVFDHWRQTFGHARAQMDAKRRKLIRDRLNDYTVADLLCAIGGYKNSPHHMGLNDRSTVYDDIEIFLRDAKHVDAGIRFAHEPPRTDLSPQTRRNVVAVADWIPPEARNAAG